MKLRRIAGGFLALVLVSAILVWANFDRILLTVPGMLIDLRTPTGPNQPIVWQTGTVAERDDRPNIVLIVADDLGWNDITFYGGGVAGGTVPTPHIDSIAQNGVHLSNARAASAVCAPSRAAIMTGRYPTRYGYEFTPMPDGMAALTRRLDRHRPDSDILPMISHLNREVSQAVFSDMGVPQSETMIPELLRQQGYHTVHIGKWHLGDTGGSQPTAQGFHESLNLASLLYLPEDHPDAVNAYQPLDPIDRFFWSVGRFAVNWNGGPRFEPDRYLTDYLTQQAVSAIEANRERPFFLYLAHWAPHTPLQALREDYETLAHIDDHNLRVYAAMILALDRGVGEVLQALEDNGLSENTLVIFTSDNGGAHYVGFPDINQPYRGWKTTFFEGGIRVPFFMQWPARIAAGGHYQDIAHHLDLFPTVAAAAATEANLSLELDGRNLLPGLTGQLDDALSPQYSRSPVFWRSGHYRVVMNGHWKLQITERPDRTWLFNLAEDPTEQNNLADQYPDRIDAMMDLLHEHEQDLPPPGWPSVLEAPITIDKPLGVPITPQDEYIYWPN